MPSALNCTTCGSSAIRGYLRSAVGEVLQCASCKGVFLSPEGPDVAAESVYSEAYFTDREAYFFHDGVVDGSGHESPHVADFRAGLDLIEAHIDPGGSLLDVGCATGTFLSLAKERGWGCRGVEVSDFAAARARQRTGCEIFAGKLEEAPFADGTFDVITMWDLLEHLPVPRRGLEDARRLLRPSGVLLVNTPNEDSLLRKLARLIYRASGGSIRMPVDRLYHHYHLHYFGAATLRVLFERAGFDLEVVKTKPIPLSRGRISPATRLVMRALSSAERLLHAEYELIVLARKPAQTSANTEGAVAGARRERSPVPRDAARA